jgi:hypothetical protein
VLSFFNRENQAMFELLDRSAPSLACDPGYFARRWATDAVDTAWRLRTRTVPRLTPAGGRRNVRLIDHRTVDEVLVLVTEIQQPLVWRALHFPLTR